MKKPFPGLTEAESEELAGFIRRDGVSARAVELIDKWLSTVDAESFKDFDEWEAEMAHRKPEDRVGYTKWKHGWLG